ncbi:MAG: hypothetical protein P4L49_00875 [Desulfosporosinus sp.]|nr:hypothetical protein [Desulfosporosinus sp.]
MKAFDKGMITLSFLYLALPTMMFLFGWLKPLYAIILVICLSLSVFSAIQDFESVGLFRDYRHFMSEAGAPALVAVLIVLLWVGFSGIGGFSFQNSDFLLRNAVFHDLISYRWPVIYSYLNQGGFPPYSGHEGALVYYLSYWLPAALVGKVFGWQVANLALYLWTAVGVLLTLYLFFRHERKSPLVLTIIFIFWSGMDIVGELIGRHIPFWGEHIEWWAGLFQYSSNTTTMYWVFNQTITTWLAVMLLMNFKNTKSILFTYALVLPFAPFSFIGLAPFVVTYIFLGPMSQGNIQKLSKLKPIILDNLKQTINLRNIVVAPVIIIVFLLYFRSNPSNLGSSGLLWSAALGIGTVKTLIIYLLFCLLEFGIYALIIGDVFKRNPWFIVAAISLLLIPNYYAGVYNDFVMRASIPALIILMVYVSRFILSEVTIYKKRRLKIYLLIFMFIGAITPIQEISRSVYMRFYHPNHLITDEIGTLSILDAKRIGAIKIYVGNDPNKSLFFKYLAK